MQCHLFYYYSIYSTRGQIARLLCVDSDMIKILTPKVVTDLLILFRVVSVLLNT